MLTNEQAEKILTYGGWTKQPCTLFGRQDGYLWISPQPSLELDPNLDDLNVIMNIIERNKIVFSSFYDPSNCMVKQPATVRIVTDNGTHWGYGNSLIEALQEAFLKLVEGK